VVVVHDKVCNATTKCANWFKLKVCGLLLLLPLLLLLLPLPLLYSTHL
jgi:hypothetical protein